MTSKSLALGIALLATSIASADIRTTIQGSSSGTTVTVSGSYSLTSYINVPSGVTVKGTSTFNFNGAGNGFVLSGTNSKLYNITVTNVNHPGIYIYGGNSCRIDSCTVTGNLNTGLQIQGSTAKNNTVYNCIAKSNADSATYGQNADGFACKFSSGSGNQFQSCDAHSNSDDGWDFWQAGASITTSSSKAYSNGSLSQGNGNGFKFGSSGMSIAMTFTSCTAYSNKNVSGRGFDTNGNTGKHKLTSCKSYSNKTADRLGNSSLSSCTMQY
jgi:parallel beta-helix repeat protein